MTSRNAPLPTTDAERRTVLLYNVSLAVRPVEGYDEPDADGLQEESRPDLVLRLTPVARDFAAVSGSLAVRRALRRTGACRTLGSTGFVRTVEDVSRGSRAANQARRRALREAALQARRDRPAEYDAALLDPDGVMPREFSVTGADRKPLEDRVPDNDCPVSHRRAASTRLVRLRRDLLAEGRDEWAHLVSLYSDDPCDLDDLLSEADSLGFTLTEPIPSAWVHRVEAENWDYDDGDDDQADEPAWTITPDPEPEPEPEPEPARRPRPPRPAFVPPPLPPMSDPLDPPARRLVAVPNAEPEPEPVRLTPDEARALRDANIAERQAEQRRLMWACDSYGHPLEHYRSASPPSDLLRCGECRRSNAWHKQYPDA